MAPTVVTSDVRDDADFYAGLPVLAGFPQIMDPARYQPLPEGWLIGLTDVEHSTRAIEAGRYQAVNTAGAAVIAAVTSALEGRPFPFVFGGDGASLAVAPRDEAAVRNALAATAAWARDELGLRLRAALIPVAAVREQGLDVRVTRYAPSAHVSYAMFTGGGLAWADRTLRADRYAVEPAAPGIRPDLSGLSCRWNDIPAAHGAILSLVVAPVQERDPAFRRLVEALLAELEASSEVARPRARRRSRRPLAARGGMDLEARATRKSGESLWMARLSAMWVTLLSFIVMRFGIRVGEFEPAVYRRTVVENSDFRKYDDSLRMTLDCTSGLADRIEARLAQAAAAGILRYGAHRQSAALMTCIVPSITEHNHIHFIDGAGGGYAMAAQGLKP